jgi:hypothetical protein
VYIVKYIIIYKIHYNDIFNAKAKIRRNGQHDHIYRAHSLKESLNIRIYAHANKLSYTYREILYLYNDKTEDTDFSY